MGKNIKNRSKELFYASSLGNLCGAYIYQDSSHTTNEVVLATEDRFRYDDVMRCIPGVCDEASCFLRSQDTCLCPKKPSLDLRNYTPKRL
jgi:hypothetical protein